MEEYPRSVTKNCHEKILEQMNNSIGIINENEIGLFGQLKYEDKDIFVLIINNYINDEDYKDKIYIEINNEKKLIKLDNLIYKNIKDNISIIKLKEKDNNIKYIEMDDELLKDVSEINYYNESIYIIQYNDISDILISYGVIKKINNNEIIYGGNMKLNYKFSPIFNLYNNKLIGICKESNKKYYNRGIFLKNNINEFIKICNYQNHIKYKYMHEYLRNKNAIIILIKIEKEDLNKKIYFLDNGYKGFKNNEWIEYYEHDNLKELNKFNTELYIDYRKYEYEKYFEPEKEGIYEIMIIFNINLIDCSYMFAGCQEIINIKFISFNTKNVTNMSYMFRDCISLKNLPDISHWGTKNVTNMSYMFYGCHSLINLPDFSKCNTKNATNMSYMFCDCISLKNLPDISHWGTKNVTNMSFMFYDYSSLISLPDISQWDTKNATNMNSMFANCSSLNILPDISKWDTKNVTNMSYMFSDCVSLKNLPDISKWDTKNLNDISKMFYNCSSLKNLQVISRWNTENVAIKTDMFYGCVNTKIPQKLLKK